MNWQFVSQKAPSFTAFFVGLVFLALAALDVRHRYFHLSVVLVALFYGYRQWKKRDTPFEKRERELRRKNL